jgi:hypothetical protein
VILKYFKNNSGGNKDLNVFSITNMEGNTWKWGEELKL